MSSRVIRSLATVVKNNLKYLVVDIAVVKYANPIIMIKENRWPVLVAGDSVMSILGNAPYA